MLQEGMIMTGYFENKAKGKPIKQDMLIFYALSLSSSITPTSNSTSPHASSSTTTITITTTSNNNEGCLYWCIPNKRVQTSTCCLPLSRLSDIYLGKHTAAFLLSVANEAPTDCCFSVVSRDRTHVNFEVLFSCVSTYPSSGR
jgi:hypothetical protein